MSKDPGNPRILAKTFSRIYNCPHSSEQSQAAKEQHNENSIALLLCPVSGNNW